MAYATACWWGYQKAFSEARQNVVRINAVVARHADHTFAAAKDIDERVQQLAAIPDAELREKSADIDQRLRDIAIGLPWVAAISVWDDSARLLVSTLGTSRGPQVSVADRAYFREVRAGASPMVISELITGRLTTQTIFNAAFPRRRAGGGFGGASRRARQALRHDGCERQAAWWPDLLTRLPWEMPGARRPDQRICRCASVQTRMHRHRGPRGVQGA